MSTLLIFLHLLEETSLLVLLPVGLGACVEVRSSNQSPQIKIETNTLNKTNLSSRQVWKVFKVFNIQLKSSKLHVSMLPLSPVC